MRFFAGAEYRCSTVPCPTATQLSIIITVKIRLNQRHYAVIISVESQSHQTLTCPVPLSPSLGKRRKNLHHRGVAAATSHPLPPIATAFPVSPPFQLLVRRTRGLQTTCHPVRQSIIVQLHISPHQGGVPLPYWTLLFPLQLRLHLLQLSCCTLKLLCTRSPT